mmetsp:Transcript_19671/g.46088  ORF Transcript_19671/g.46088 Transcript_19671/m.46088 type:complete len:141 (+) Transcript_19671:424-846(+)
MFRTCGVSEEELIGEKCHNIVALVQGVQYTKVMLMQHVPCSSRSASCIGQSTWRISLSRKDSARTQAAEHSAPCHSSSPYRPGNLAPATSSTIAGGPAAIAVDHPVAGAVLPPLVAPDLPERALSSGHLLAHATCVCVSC